MNQLTHRYVSKFNSENLDREYFDVVIVGAGIAGLFTALKLPHDLKVLVLSKSSYKNTNSYRAQGGVACVMDDAVDHVDKHFNDTVVCGRYKNNRETVRILVDEARENINELIKLGVPFERLEDGSLSLGREGAHSENRILHVGDYTGKSIMDHLYKHTIERENISIREDAFVIDLLTIDGTCKGVLYQEDDEKKICYASHTVIATGGIGAIFSHSTNADIATGDGIAFAKRAGARLKSMSYLQYHPTVFFDVNHKEIFLVSEAVRGEGAIIRNYKGDALMAKAHPLKDLAPRDVVSNEIFKSMKKDKSSNVLLDVTMHDREWLKNRFPFIYNKCLENGYDLSENFIPIAPMMHYFMGGIDVTENGLTNISNLYACGECSHTGVHGANRLASNSLLEAVVFANRIARNIELNKKDIEEVQEEIYNDKQLSLKSISCVQTLGEKLNAYFITVHREPKGLMMKELCKSIKVSNSMNQTREEIEAVNKYYVINEIIDDIIKEEMGYVNQTANG